jgi:hypothetical protein
MISFPQCLLIPDNSSLQINPALTQQQLMKSDVGSTVCASSTGCKFSAKFDNTPFIVVLVFHGSLAMIQMLHDDESYGREWSSWSEENEAKRKAFHDQWLKGVRCCQTGRYSWGTVASIFDPGSAASTITFHIKGTQGER